MIQNFEMWIGKHPVKLSKQMQKLQIILDISGVVA
jgi:hypothetical protein